MSGITKVAHVMRRVSPQRWGGTECVVFNISEELIRRGIESPVHCTDMFETAGKGRIGAVPVIRHPYVFPWIGLSTEAKEKLKLKGGSPLSLPLFFGLLREKNVSVIHTHVQHRLGGMARTAAKLRGIPYVVSLHGGYYTLPEIQAEKMAEPFKGKAEWGKFFGWLFGSRNVLNDADAVICVGRAEFEEVKRRHPDKAVFYLPNGVNVPRFSAANGTVFRAAFNIGESEKIVLCVSRIDYQKNQLDLVDAFARFAASRPEYRLVLIGAVTVEAYGEKVRQKIAAFHLQNRVTVIEGLRPDDSLLPSAYKAADFFVLPSLHEPFGIVVLEAWAAGIPVIANRVGGVAGFAVDRETVLFAEPGDPEDLKLKMGALVESAELRGELVNRAGLVVREKFGWERIADDLVGIYQCIVRKT